MTTVMRCRTFVLVVLGVYACSDPIAVDDTTPSTSDAPGGSETSGMTGVVTGDATMTPSTTDSVDDTTTTGMGATTTMDESTSTGAEPIGCAAGRYPVFLNRDGGTYSNGEPDSTMNTTTLFPAGIRLAPWDDSVAPWNEIMGCVTEMLAPFNITVTDVDPGAVDHLEIVMSGDASADHGLGMFGGIGPAVCAPVHNGIGFVFGGTFPDASPAFACVQPAFVLGLLASLQPTTLPCDAMSPVACPSDTYAFADEQAACEQSCCGDASQNSHARMLEVFGPCP